MKKKFSKYLIPSITNARKRIRKEVEFINYEKAIYPKNGLCYLIKTYGCQGNLADSEKISGILESLGYTKTEIDTEASVIIFNTCAIRENAENRVFGELGRIKNLKKKNKDILLIICGCMSQEEEVIKSIESKHPEVDIILGTHNIHKIGSYIEEAKKLNSRVYEVYSIDGDIVENVPVKRDYTMKAWINIMYGCDEFCTYCIVPYTRGKERSRKSSDIINEVIELVKEGYQEITLLGQNVNAYGNDFLDIKYTFWNLLEDLSQTGIKRIRFTTSHPKDLDLETIKVMAKYPNIMPHIHLPVQSGSDSILHKMNRKYTSSEYLNKVNLLKEYIKDISITTDIIVGFPNETEDDFKQTLELVKNAQFEGAYTFIFSKRAGTPAYHYEDNISEETKKQRLLELNELINEQFLNGHKRFENQDVEVLVERCSEKDPNYLTGYTKHNKVVNFQGDPSLIGKIVNVHIEKAYSWHLLGILKK